MSNGVERKTYRSPAKKLLRFFERSRDGWKRKCQAAKRKVKSFDTRLRVLRKNRDRWKGLAKQQQVELKQLRKELETVKSGNRWRPRRRGSPTSSPPRCPGISIRQA